MTDRILMPSSDVGDLEEQYVVNAIRSGLTLPSGSVLADVKCESIVGIISDSSNDD